MLIPGPFTATQVLLARSLSKAILVAALPSLFSCFPYKLRAAWQPPVSVIYENIGDRIQRKAAAAAAAAALAADLALEVASKKPEGRQHQRGGIFRRLGSRRGGEVAAAEKKTQESAENENTCDKLEKEGSCAGGLLLRQDGYPWDADVARRVLSYGCAVASLVMYVRSLQFAADMVSSS